MTAKRKPWVWLALARVLIAASVAWFLLPIEEWILEFNEWIEGLGVWSFVLFGLVYVLGTNLLAPAVAMSIAAGLAFGAWGIPLVLVAATVGAALAFLLARYWARDKVRRLLENHPEFGAIDKAVRVEGCKILILLRHPILEICRRDVRGDVGLSPLPSPRPTETSRSRETRDPSWDASLQAIETAVPCSLMSKLISA
jgi:uncharacterized membrane protein YdjX (TVP38/TMEM64 family)